LTSAPPRNIGKKVEDTRMADRPKRKISGPGAADFIGAPGGADLPENATDKGTGLLRDEQAIAADDSRLTPDLEVDENDSDDKPTL
jgi:hypothetical protein